MKKRNLLASCLVVGAFLVGGAKASFALEPGMGGHASGIANDATSCAAAVKFAESRAGTPPGLLGAISMAESGRTEPRTGRFEAWPWSINVEGKDFFFETKQAAIAAVLQAHAMGIRSIDVGCMQINLMHHPLAFQSLDQAFDPWINADYGADFLGRLRAATGNWASATAAYHSMTPELGAEYQRHVAAFLPEGSRYGLSVQPITAMLVLSRTPVVDPYNVMTPELKARLRQDMADRNARDSALGLRTGNIVAASRPAAIPVSNRGGAPMMRQARVVGQTRTF